MLGLMNSCPEVADTVEFYNASPSEKNLLTEKTFDKIKKTLPTNSENQTNVYASTNSKLFSSNFGIIGSNTCKKNANVKSIFDNKIFLINILILVTRVLSENNVFLMWDQLIQKNIGLQNFVEKNKSRNT